VVIVQELVAAQVKPIRELEVFGWYVPEEAEQTQRNVTNLFRDVPSEVRTAFRILLALLGERIGEGKRPTADIIFLLGIGVSVKARSRVPEPGHSGFGSPIRPAFQSSGWGKQSSRR
jgi:hypothetical protein